MSDENWIGGLPPVVQHAITDRMTWIQLEPGKVLRRAGDPPEAMYHVAQGYLRLLGLHRDGRQVLILIYRPGNNFAESTLVTRRELNHTMVALTAAKVGRLATADFWSLYQRHPEIPEALCRKFANIISHQFDDRDIRATHRLRQLVAMTFLNLAAQCGQTEVGGAIVVGIPLTQTDIAEHLEVTRQALQREVGNLKKANVLSQANGHWRIEDIARLRLLAE